MELTVHQISQLVGGKIIGDGDTKINTISRIEEGQEGGISFLSNPKYLSHIYDTKSSAVIVGDTVDFDKKVVTTLIKVKDAYKSFSKLLDFYSKSLEETEFSISKSAVVSEEAILSKDVAVGHNTVIDKGVKIGNSVVIKNNVHIGRNVTIGNNVILNSGVVIYHDCVIGSNITIHANSVVGADGFGFGLDEETGAYYKVPQVGNVIIEDDVEIGSCTTIDRATLGSTIIRKGVKLDNLIQVAHNVEIGKNTVMAAQSGVAGSTKIGENCMLGGQIGIVGHLKIGNNVKFAAKSGVLSNVKDNMTIQGNPGYSILDYKKSYIYFKRLPQLVAKVDKLELEIKNSLKNE